MQCCFGIYCLFFLISIYLIKFLYHFSWYEFFLKSGVMQKQKCLDYCVRPEMEEALLLWNDKDVAFIKSDVEDGKNLWSVYAFDGTKLASTDNRDYAFVVAKQNNLQPQSVH